MTNTQESDIATGQRFMRRPAVEHATGLTRSTLYQYMAEGRFPKATRISPRVVVWLESEVLAWIRERIATRENDI